MITDLEERRQSLAELEAERAYNLRQRELEIEAAKADAARASNSGEHRSKLGTATISVVSAVLGAVATIGAAAISGQFSVQKTAIEQDATALLEQQKFSFELIQSALTSVDQEEQVRRLQFFARIGLLPTVNTDELRALAEDGERYLRSGGAEGQALPSYADGARARIAQIQVALNQRGICDTDVEPDGMVGVLTENCLAKFLPQANPQERRQLAQTTPELLLSWIAAGRVPPDWRALAEAERTGGSF